jgi:DNA polymerase
MQQESLFGDIIVSRSSSGKAPRQQEPQPEREMPLGESELAQRLVSVTEPWVNAPSLDSLNQMICTCQKCPLGQSRTRFVFGVGNPDADIVVIGEAPGADEDATGEPFVGMAGQLLNKILAAIHLPREQVFICNILKCRPPGNRTPERFEVEQCEPYLLKQLDLIKPKFILALGLTAANTLLNRKARMGELRGTVHDYHGIRVVVTYHPAALLRNQQWKRPAWEDVQMLRRLYDESMKSES